MPNEIAIESVLTGFRKTRIMNAVGAVGIAITGVALFFNKLTELPTSMLVFIVALYVVFGSIPAATAVALSHKARTPLRHTMLWANWGLIGLWCISVISTIFVTHSNLGQTLMSALMFVIPELINIRALREALATQISTQEPIPSASKPDVTDSKHKRQARNIWRGFGLGVVITLLVVALAGGIYRFSNRQSEVSPASIQSPVQNNLALGPPPTQESHLAPAQPRQVADASETEQHRSAINIDAGNPNVEQSEKPWVQTELTEQFMRSISKSQCMSKSVASLKLCSSDHCLKNVGGIIGDCVTYGTGTISDFCSTFNQEYIERYCASNTLDARSCGLLQLAPTVMCKGDTNRR